MAVALQHDELDAGGLHLHSEGLQIVRQAEDGGMDALAVHISRTGEYDLKYLIKAICLSDAYQRTSKPLPANKDASRMVLDGLSIRMIRDYDTINDQFLNRVDVLWGSAVLRPEFGVVVPNDPTNFT